MLLVLLEEGYLVVVDRHTNHNTVHIKSATIMKKDRTKCTTVQYSNEM